MLKSFNDLESGQIVHNHFEGKMTVSRLDFFHDGKEVVCLVDRKGMIYPAYQFSPDEWSLVTEDQREDCSSQEKSNNEEVVSREDVENKIISLTKEIYDLYKKYNPKANYLLFLFMTIISTPIIVTMTKTRNIQLRFLYFCD